MGVSLNMFYQEFEKLPAYQQDIVNVAFKNRMPSDPDIMYKEPSRIVAMIVRRIKKLGREDLLHVCGRCGGTGLYDMFTRYKDDKGRPICFKCNGEGLKLKKLSKKKLVELGTIYLK